ncbi:MAG: flagellar hook-length control protein FliK [Sporomusaceae bacterium]|nr:flagellar hook-length control protein FliK [Sporomusaceae bacterium]
MTVMFNMMPADQKQNAVLQNVSSKTGTNNDKSTKGFAKVLTIETDKKELNVDSKVKDDDNQQLMAAMMGMVVPMVVNFNIAEQAICTAADTLEGAASATQIQLVDAVPVIPNIQLTDALPVVPNLQLTGAVPIVIQAQQANAMSEDVGLATLFPQKTAINTQVDDTQLGKFAELQVQLQNKAIISQVEVTEVSIKNTEMVPKDLALSKIIPSLTTMGNANILGKISNKQLEGKKITNSQTNVEATNAANTFGVIDNVDVKPMLATQASVNGVSNLAGDEKGNLSTLLGTKEQLNADSILPNQSAKNTDAFTNLLSQQGIKIENQSGMLEVKQVAAQPISEPYNIASQIVDQARLVTKSQNTEMIIQLKPEHLGELTFKVTVEKGFVSASFHSNNAEVRSIIESSLAQLKQDLSNQGFKIDNVGVYAGLGQFFSNGQQSGGNQQPVVKVHHKKNEEEFLNLFEANDSADMTLDVSGVDYRV